MCAMHAINNLFQMPIVDRSLLDAACHTLSPSIFNPHRSWLGLGNYDVNVIMHVITSIGEAFTKWFDSRQDVDVLLSSISTDDCVGLILNVDVDKFFYKTRHWYAVKRIGNVIRLDD